MTTYDQRRLGDSFKVPDFVEGLGESTLKSEKKDNDPCYPNAPIVKPVPDKKISEVEQITEETLKSGLKSDQGKSRVGLIPPMELLELGDLFALGARKYSDYNWMLGMDFHRLYDAMLRHALKWWAGEENDPIDKQTHLVSVAFGALCLLHYMNDYERYKDFDDRPHTWTNERIRTTIKK